MLSRLSSLKMLTALASMSSTTGVFAQGLLSVTNQLNDPPSKSPSSKPSKDKPSPAKIKRASKKKRNVARFKKSKRT